MILKKFIKRMLCRILLKKTIHGSQHIKKHGLGMILPEQGVKKLKIGNESVAEYDFYVNEALQDYYLVNKDSRRILFVGSTDRTEFDKAHSPEEIIRHDLEIYWDTIMCISKLIDANGNRKLENNIIDKFGGGFLSFLLYGKVNINLHFY